MLLNIGPLLLIYVPNVNNVAFKIICHMIFSQQWNRTDYSDQRLFSHHYFDYRNYAASQQYSKQGEDDVKGGYPVLVLGKTVLLSLDYQTSEVNHHIIYCYTLAESQNASIIPKEGNKPLSGKLITK